MGGDGGGERVLEIYVASSSLSASPLPAALDGQPAKGETSFDPRSEEPGRRRSRLTPSRTFAITMSTSPIHYRDPVLHRQRDDGAFHRLHDLETSGSPPASQRSCRLMSTMITELPQNGGGGFARAVDRNWRNENVWKAVRGQSRSTIDRV